MKRQRYLLDENLAPSTNCDLFKELSGAGMLLEAHGTHLAEGAPDHEVVEFCAQMGWPFLTGDSSITKYPARGSNPLTIKTTGASGARVFICRGGRGVGYTSFLENIMRVRHKLDQFCHKHRRLDAFIANVAMLDKATLSNTVSKKGKIELAYTWP